MKIGFGEYYPPGPGGAQDHLRAVFLERVRIHCPQVLDSLIQDVLPTYAQHRSTEDNPQPYEDLPAPLKRALRMWATRCHLTELWVYEHAIATLEYRRSHPGERNFWVYPNADKGYLSPFDEEVRLSWDPTVETEAAFTERARRSLAEYKARTKDIAKRAGFQPVPEHRNLEHFDWLVWWQVKKLSRREIADRANVTPDAVKKARNRLAKEMGLTLPKGSQFGSGS